MQTTPNSWSQILQILVGALDHPLDHPFVGGPILFMAAMICMLIIGNPMIAWLQKKRWKKNATNEETWAVREDTPDTHQAKQGTPSMGGIGIIAATVLSCIALLSSLLVVIALLTKQTILWPLKLDETAAWFLLPAVFVCYGVLGFADDWSKASGRGGLRAKAKLFGQFILAVIFAQGLITLITSLSTQNLADGLRVFPPLVSISRDYAPLSLAIFAFTVVTTSNAVNLTDGIDGLASGLFVQCGLILFLVSLLTDAPFGSGFFCLALAGACLGFLNFNKYKARVFMGDTGSLAIGAALGAGAILQHAVFLLPFIGFIYFVEMFSVIAQVLWFKWTKRKTGEGKRLFRRAPLHHHFELCGWSEWRVVGTFWIVNLLTSILGLWLWHSGVLPRWP